MWFYLVQIREKRTTEWNSWVKYNYNSVCFIFQHLLTQNKRVICHNKRWKCGPASLLAMLLSLHGFYGNRAGPGDWGSSLNHTEQTRVTHPKSLNRKQHKTSVEIKIRWFWGEKNSPHWVIAIAQCFSARCKVSTTEHPGKKKTRVKVWMMSLCVFKIKPH